MSSFGKIDVIFHPFVVIHLFFYLPTSLHVNGSHWLLVLDGGLYEKKATEFCHGSGTEAWVFSHLMCNHTPMMIVNVHDYD